MCTEDNWNENKVYFKSPYGCFHQTGTTSTFQATAMELSPLPVEFINDINLTLTGDWVQNGTKLAKIKLVSKNADKDSFKLHYKHTYTCCASNCEC